MENIFFILLLFIIVGVAAPIVYKSRINNDGPVNMTVYEAYLINMMLPFFIISLIYSSEINTTVILIGILLVWAIYKLILKTKRGKKLEKDPRFYKSLTLPAPFVGIVIELYLFLVKPFGEYGFVASELQFKIFATLSILLLIWTLYFNTKSFTHFVFKERDGFRKVFIAGEVMVVLIYAAFTIFYIFNTNLLTFSH